MKYYIVKKEDTLCIIAKKFNVTVTQIAELNDITNVDYIKEGQKLLICQ